MEEKFLPQIARLESCIICQLKCPCCKIEEFYNENPPAVRYLSSDDFYKFIKKNPFIKIIELSNNGEIFLNPELKEIIKIANIHKVVLTARNGANFNYVSNEVLEAMVKYKFHSLNVAIDGATPETYKIYRVGGNLNRVIENIERLNFYKKKFNSMYPILYFQFIIFGHNEHEIPMVKKLAKELKMRLYFKRNLFHDYSPINNPEYVAKELNLSKIVVDNSLNIEPQIKRMDSCTQLWFEPQIQCDGTFLGCCSQYYDTGLNVFENGLEDVLNSSIVVHAKNILCKKEEVDNNSMCAKCPFFIYRIRTNSFITDNMIFSAKECIEKKVKETYIY